MAGCRSQRDIEYMRRKELWREEAAEDVGSRIWSQMWRVTGSSRNK